MIVWSMMQDIISGDKINGRFQVEILIRSVLYGTMDAEPSHDAQVRTQGCGNTKLAGRRWGRLTAANA